MAIIKTLNKTTLDKLKPQDKIYGITDSLVRGFMCLVSPKGTRTFVYKYMCEGKQIKKTLGKYPDISPEMARGMIAEIKDLLVEGVNPRTEEKKQIAIKQEEENKTLTFDAFFEIYKQREYVPLVNAKLKDLKTDIERKKQTHRLFKDHLYLYQKYISPILGNIKLNEFTYEDILTLDREMHKASGKPLNTTMNRCLAKISVVFNKAMDWGYTPERRNPCAKFKKYPERKNTTFLTEPEMKAFLEALNKRAESATTQATYNACMATKVTLLTGPRKGNVLFLKWEDVHLNDNYYLLTKTKTGKPLKVDFDNNIKSIFESIPKKKNNPFVFAGDIPYHPIEDIRKTVSIITKTLGIKKNITPHILRHSFASLCVNKGIPIYELSQMLGHTNIQTTKRYAHLETEHIKKQRAAITGLFANV